MIPWRMMKSRKRPPLEKRKHPGVYAVTLLAGSLAGAFTEVLSLCSSENKELKIKRPSTRVWLNFYRNSREIEDQLIEIFRVVLMEEIVSFHRNVLACLKMPMLQEEDQRAQWGKLYLEPAINEALRMETVKLKRELSNEVGLSDEEFKKLNKYSDLLQFMSLVVLPCVAHYRTDPWSLYQNALRGNIEAICKLIRIDRPCASPILGNERILDHISRLEQTDSKQYKQTIGKAVSSGAPVQLDNAQVKAIIGSFLHLAFADLSGGESNQIRSVDMLEGYHEINQLRKGTIDLNLQGSPEAFRKAMNRHKKKWENPQDIKV